MASTQASELAVGPELVANTKSLPVVCLLLLPVPPASNTPSPPSHRRRRFTLLALSPHHTHHSPKAASIRFPRRASSNPHCYAEPNHFKVSILHYFLNSRFITARVLANQRVAITALQHSSTHQTASMFYSTALLAATAVFSSFANAQDNGTTDISDLSIDPNSVEFNLRQAWCRAQRNTCPVLCEGFASSNTCDPVSRSAQD